MGRWDIEGLDGPALCWNNALKFSLRVAQAQSQDVMVRYIGRRSEYPNRSATESDFVMHPDGTRDHRVDPTWWENKR
jgi:hypothetical protein